MFVEYKIIGGDGREYGPVLLEEMKSWIREGRVSATTLVSRSDLQTWLPAAQFVEFQPEIGQSKVTMPTLAPGQELMERVGFFPRLGAYLIDQVLLGVLVYTIWSVFFSSLPDWQIPDASAMKFGSSADVVAFMQTLGAFSKKITIILLPTFFLYEVILNGKFGATVGKRIIGARIVRPDGQSINFRIAALRWLGERLSDMFLCYVGHFFILVREDKRALHDLIAGTQVIYKR